VQALDDLLSESIRERVKRARQAVEANAAATKSQLENLSDKLLRTHQKQQRALEEEARHVQKLMSKIESEFVYSPI
jgi:hypothetical protein